MSDWTKIYRWYGLEPVDAWFFKDGRPSNRGEDQSDLQSLFPPHPTTVVGAMRAAFARNCKHNWNGYSDWPDEIKNVLGNGDALGDLDFVGPFLKRGDELLFPMPQHILGEIKDDEFIPTDALVPSAEKILCDLGDVYLPVPGGLSSTKKGEKGPTFTQDYFVTSTGLSKILNAELPSSEDCIHRSELYQMESRVGIARNEETRTTKTAEEGGGLYSPSYVRLKKCITLVMGVSGLPKDGWDLPEFFPLGGESRLAAYAPLEKAPDFPKNADNGNLIYLATPARFEGTNWYGGGPEDSANALKEGFDGEIQTATFDRPLNIGGWNSRLRRPEDMKAYVKAGSIWWLEKDVELSNASVLNLGERNAFGFGMAFIGKEFKK